MGFVLIGRTGHLVILILVCAATCMIGWPALTGQPSGKGFAVEPARPEPESQKPLSVRVRAIFQDSRGAIRELKPGTTLRSNQNYALAFQATRQACVYVFQVDSRSQITQLFPSPHFPHHKNPVRPGVWHWIPAKDKWIYLDHNRGQEKIYVVFSTKRDAKLEGLHQRLASAVSDKQRLAASKTLETQIATRGIARVGHRKRERSVYAGKVFEAADQVITATGADAYYTLSFKHR